MAPNDSPPRRTARRPQQRRTAASAAFGAVRALQAYRDNPVVKEIWVNEQGRVCKDIY